MTIDLAVVMPVYNEEECIMHVIESWLSVLSDLGMRFQIIVLNDGSRDGTQKALQVFHHDNRLEIINKANSGHGPTILMGYKRAVQLADWTFHCDSDDTMKPDYFTYLWEQREEFDALFGLRTERKQNASRRLVSACSRIMVRLLFGNGVTDVNTPYRLIRSSILEQIVCQIPPDTFAPNVIISGALSKYRLRIYEHPVPHENRKTGKASIVKWKLIRSAVKSFWQTLFCRPSITNIHSRVI
jgi:dolichol-phosphate mannosyltransferase